MDLVGYAHVASYVVVKAFRYLTAVESDTYLKTV
ncbi:hypothetical protein CfE428DRAFT_5934 [Chthoniobacter flavus Ellin428]|uniref:Uncharacterized protein n=2 Tax=Chthoniobacter flavus TaxID=191863 RepID=B4DAJ3_9BACT|nr:hypothetical protein CfE428DRAFT_5934 [Chthoniobacter flavus Ellin428]TCO85229.1 hypothetical protein EV701_13229 [Chthoniobacter flavus]